MKCTWNETDFLKEISKLQNLINNETNIRKRLYLEKVLDISNKLYYETFSNSPKPNVTAKQRLISIFDSHLIYGRYYSIVKDFFNIVYKRINEIDDISLLLEQIDTNGNFDFMNTGATISCDKTLSLVQNFYKNFDSELYQYFLEAFNDREHTLNISPLLDENLKTDGSTLFIDGVRKNFITIYQNTPISTYICAIHEYGHAIANLINPEAMYADNEDFFAEVASIFPELVALYESGNNFEEIQILYTMYTTLVTYVNSAEFLCLHTPLLNSWEENKYVMNNNFFTSLENSYDIDDECFEDLLSTTIEDDGVYIISYIVSLELLNIYKKDKRKALKLFKNFLKIPFYEDSMSFVIENIPINKSINKEIESILSNFNKELKKRR